MANGVYIPFGQRSWPANVLPSVVAPAQTISGHGSPEGVVPGNPGQRYKDIDTDPNNVYIKIAGSAEVGWRLVGAADISGTSSAGGTSNVLFKDHDPSGVDSVRGAAVCFGIGAFEGALWVKSTSTTSADDWVNVIAVPGM